MHISEGVLSGPVLASGAALAVGGVAYGLRRLDNRQVPAVALLASTFFVASLIHVPVGPVSVHLVLNGLLGLLLGWVAFPAILVALVLQAVLFQFGGLTTLGVNTLVMAFPAVLVSRLLRKLVLSRRRWVALAAAAGAGALSVLGSALLIAACLVLAGEHFWEVAQLTVAAHIPVMIVEGVVTAACVLFLLRVKPELLQGAGLPQTPSSPSDSPEP